MSFYWNTATLFSDVLAMGDCAPQLQSGITALRDHEWPADLGVLTVWPSQKFADLKPIGLGRVACFPAPSIPQNIISGLRPHLFSIFM